MSETKVNLSIILKGRVMHSEQEAKAQNAYDIFSVEVSDAKGKNRERIQVSMRGTKPAKQSINLSEEAYQHMINAKEVPFFIKEKHWKALNERQRLEMHLDRICQHLDGISYTYNVLEA